MKRSIREQLCISFIGTLVLVIVLSVLANTLFLEQFYRAKKQTTIKSAYETINKASKQYELEDDNFQKNLLRLCYTSNLSMLIMNTGGKEIFSNTANTGRIKNILFEHILPAVTQSSDIELPKPEDIRKSELDFNNIKKENPDIAVIDNTETYEIDRIKDEFSGLEYVEIWGRLGDESLFIIRTPLASINESISITNQFMFYLLLFVALFGTSLVWILAKRISEPIKQLTILSSKMANLDFDVKFESESKNEIGVLGNNFNSMSSKLEDTISELQVANDKLKEDIKRQEKINMIQSDFVSNVSHELKTPIALIQGYAEGLEDDDICSNKESRQYYTNVIIDEATKMNHLIQDLLTLQSLENDTKIDKIDFDLVELLVGIVGREQTLNPQISFHYSGLESIIVNSDPYKIEQVIINYINNAINHTKDNRVKLSILKYNSKVTLSVFNKCENIPDEDSDRIWDKFFKVDKSHTREYGGSGVGLSIVKAIMTALDGEYGFENTQDGVKFYIIL